MDTILTYGGKPVTEMSREELIDALTEVAGMIAMEREVHQGDLEVWQRIAASRKRQLDPSRVSDLLYHDDAPPLPSAFKGLSERDPASRANGFTAYLMDDKKPRS